MIANPALDAHSVWKAEGVPGGLWMQTLKTGRRSGHWMMAEDLRADYLGELQRDVIW